MNVQSIWREIDSAAFQEGIPESLIHEGMLNEGGVHHLLAVPGRGPFPGMV